MKKALIVILSLLAVATGAAQTATYKFAERDTASLYLDLYQPEMITENTCCVIFVFGGGFVSGQRNSEEHVAYAKQLAERGFTVACIDYRLGLRGANMKGIHSVYSVDRAVQMATEDLFSATKYLLENASELRINPKRIVLCGSSAGAITVLQADYELCNRTALAAELPADFHYAGVLSFSGAIYSHNGALKYKEQPAPTFLLHGIDDRLVTYKSIRFGKLGLFGTKPIVRRFEKFNYPYMAYRYEGLGHEVAMLMTHNIDISIWFINEYVLRQRKMQINTQLYDPDVQSLDWGTIRAGKAYNKKS